MLNETTPNVLNRFRSIFAILVLTVCFSGIAMAQSVLTDDAHTSSATKDVDTNFGTNPNLTVSPTNNIYLKFKLSPTLPAGIQGSDVAKATLKLYLGTVTSPGTLLKDLQPAGAWTRSWLPHIVGTSYQERLATFRQVGFPGLSPSMEPTSG